MFKDIEYKLNYHKKKIIQSFIKRGIYLNDEIINAKLSDIEMRMSIFTKPVINEGDLFDIEEFNNAINEIYNDLLILYKLLDDITVKEYNNIKDYINAHLLEFNSIASSYLKRAEVETNSTSLGKTLLFKDSNVKYENTDSNTVVKLGEVNICDASKIACIANIDNIDYQNLIFQFTDMKTGAKLNCNAYNYNHDLLQIPGIKKVKNYDVNVSSNQIINSMLELPIIIEKPMNGQFLTLAGKNKVTCKTIDGEGNITGVNTSELDQLVFKEHSYIDFYIVKGDNVSFRFNKEPLATNFNLKSNRVENLDYIQHFFIECDAGFAFDIELEKGNIYAAKEPTIIQKDKLFYSGDMDIHDFSVINTKEGTERKYEVNAIIKNDYNNEAYINSIAIKSI